MKITALVEAEFFAFVLYLTMEANPEISLDNLDELQKQAGMDELSFQIGMERLVENDVLEYSSKYPYH